MAPSFRGAAQERHCSDSLGRVGFCCRLAMITCDRLTDLDEQILFERQTFTAMEPVDPKVLALLPY